MFLPLDQITDISIIVISRNHNMAATCSIQSDNEVCHDIEAQSKKREDVGIGFQAIASAERRLIGDPAPLGLLSFAHALFLISLFGVHPNGVMKSNVLIASLICFGGLGQTIAGIFEFIQGNTVKIINSSTVHLSL